MEEGRESRRPRSVHLASFGCQMNLVDSELVRGDLLRAGYRMTDEMSKADVILVNTCSVRDHAEAKVWSLLGRTRQMKEHRPHLKVGVLGCMAQRVREEIIRRAPHVDLVLGTYAFRETVSVLDALTEDAAPVVSAALRADPSFPPDTDRDVTARLESHRAYVSVMRGCDHHCAYCIVPSTRGREVSRPLPAVVEETRRLVDDGVREVIFLGQNINTYGRDRADQGLADLLEATSKIEGLDRIRFLTSNPFDMTEDLMRRIGSTPRVMPWLHIPAQSGSDAVLERMRRDYTAARYDEVVAWARRHIPDVEITSDFIVGFPGETDADFDATYGLVERTGFVQCYVFKYSPRPKTRSALHMDDDVPETVKQERNVALLGLQRGISQARNDALIGRTVEVLVDGVSRTRADMLTGREPGNRIVHCPGDASLAGTLIDVTIREAGAYSLIGARAT